MFGTFLSRSAQNLESLIRRVPSPKLHSIDRPISTMSRSSSSSFPLFLVILTLISSAFAAASPSLPPPRGKKILVLLDDFAVKSSHSLYFASLSSRGYDLDFKLSDDPSASLRHYSHYLYDGLILFCPSTERFGGSIDQAAILDFVDSGHDLIIAADANASELIKDIATECGVDFDEDSSAMVVDHLSYSVSEYEGDHTLIVANDFIEADIILGNEKIKAPVLFQGIGHSINPANSLVFKVLSASPAAYSANPKSKLSAPPSLSGSAISLVSVMQARNNARVLISGSLCMFSNRFFRSNVPQSGATIRHQKAGNEQFLTEISKWIFHERGHLQAVNVRHNKAGEVDEPAMYRINDDLEYSVEIYEWSGTNWEPYAANDVQVQFYMMSPYVLKTLSADKRGVFSTSFKVPDVYGVFQFKVEYQRLGYTGLSLSKQIPVRPFRHNEYERFIPTAYPYYGATFSMMAGFFLFTFVHLYNK